MAKALMEHISEVYSTLDKGSTGKNIRHDVDALAGNLKAALPMLAKDPQYVTMDDMLNSGVGVMPLSVKGLPKLPETEFSRAHAIAQQNAALPIEQGGLGLHTGNTAMERAKELGFDTTAYHGTNYPGFDKFNTDGAEFTKTEGTGAFFSRNPELSSSYTDISYPGAEPAVIPVMLRTGKTKNINFGGNNWDDYKGKSTDDYVRKARESGKYESVDIKNVNDAGMGGYDINGDTIAVFSPKNIRSKFAAFDPMKKNSANILASGLLGSLLLGDDEKTPVMGSIIKKRAN